MSEHLAIVVLAVACGVLAVALALKPGPEPHTCAPCVPCPALTLPTPYALPEDYDASTTPPPPTGDHDALTRWLEERARAGAPL